MKSSFYFPIALSLLLATGCEDITVVNQLQGPGLTITSIDPEMGGPGITVEIEGSGFGSIVAENMVTFDGINAAVKAASATRIIAIVPEGVATGPVNVRVGEETAVGPVFTLDERLAFVGEYIAQDYSMTYTGEPDGIAIDTTITVSGEAKISVNLSKGSINHLELNFEDFIGKGLLQTIPVSVDIDDLSTYESYLIAVVEHQSLASVSSGAFELNKIAFEVTAIGGGTILTLPSEFSGEGSLMDDGSILLNFSYRILFFGILSGEAILEKQDRD
jgi:hypothetical protein